MLSDLREKTIAAMQELFGGDSRRIEHAMNVLSYAEQILAHEPGSREVVVAAAILHDIGIHEAERKHGSAAGKYQEIEGPPIAREIMRRLGYGEASVDHVCRIIANHHSAGDIDTPEFRIVWDADWLVNLPGEHANTPPAKLRRLISRIFRTATGRTIAEGTFASRLAGG